MIEIAPAMPLGSQDGTMQGKGGLLSWQAAFPWENFRTLPVNFRVSLIHFSVSP